MRALIDWFLRTPPQVTYCEWVPGPLLVEPGISDVDQGRWSRREFHCWRCGATRPMWHQVDTSTVLEPCPSTKAEPTRDGDA